MNAYELSDWLADPLGYKMGEIAAMLRQQADRIAELEEDNEAFVKIASDEHKIAVEQEQRVLELEKQIKDAVEVGIAEGFVRAHKTSAEPVAWINRYEDGSHGYLRWDKDDSADLCTPLYTTPQTKLLSDEEIISEWIGNDRNYYNFARAIQKRILGK